MFCQMFENLFIICAKKMVITIKLRIYKFQPRQSRHSRLSQVGLLFNFHPLHTHPHILTYDVYSLLLDDN